MESSTLRKTLSKIERLSQDPKTKMLAISLGIRLNDQLQRLEDAKLEGIKEGREEVKELRDREIVLNMHKEKLSAGTIARYTKIPLEKVKDVIESVGQ